MNNKLVRRLMRFFMRFHVALMQWSRGHLGTRFFGLKFQVLHTTGRRTGRERVVPISYFAVDGRYFLVGSNWGRKANASWYYNLKAHPQTLVEVEGLRIQVKASEATPREYEELWQSAEKNYPGYRGYKARTARHIPIVILTPEKKANSQDIRE